MDNNRGEYFRNYLNKNRKRISEYQKEYREKNKIALAESRKRRRQRQRERGEYKQKSAPASWFREHSRKIRKETPWKFMIKGAARRSKKLNIKFDLDDQWARARWTGKCELSGLLFCTGRSMMLFWASIDRIRPELGYTKENCRFILFGINTLKGAGNDEDVMKIARALCDYSSSPAPPASSPSLSGTIRDAGRP